MQVPLAELPPGRDRGESEESSNRTEPGTTDKFGLSLQPLTPQSASRYGLEAGDQGLLVTRVEAGSNAANEGIRVGDLIQEVNNRPVRTIAEFTSAIQQSGTRPALVLLKRRSAVIYLSLRSSGS